MEQNLIAVPAHCRPPIRPAGGIRFETALRRAEAAAIVLAESYKSVLGDMVSNLGDLVERSPEPLCPASAAAIFAAANDLRGIAAPLGAPLITEISNAICDVVQPARAEGRHLRPLLRVLHQTVSKAHDVIGRGDRIRHEAEIRSLMTCLREKIAAES